MKTPSRRAIGVCTSQENSITSKVTQSACSSVGSTSAERQLRTPAGWIAPSPSHLVKLSASTPTSGPIAKITKTARAGSAIHATGPCCPARTSRGCERGGASGAVSELTCRPRDEAWPATGPGSCADRLVHVVGELLRADAELEQLADVVQQGGGLGGGQRLVPRLREDRGLARGVVDELQPRLVVLVRHRADLAARGLPH